MTGMNPQLSPEEIERLARLFGEHHHRSHAGLDPPIARRDLAGPRVEAERRLRIAHPQRFAAGAEQRIEIARIAGDLGHVATQVRAGIFGQRLDDRAGRIERAAARRGIVAVTILGVGRSGRRERHARQKCERAPAPRKACPPPP